MSGVVALPGDILLLQVGTGEEFTLQVRPGYGVTTAKAQLVVAANRSVGDLRDGPYNLMHSATPYCCAPHR